MNKKFEIFSVREFPSQQYSSIPGSGAVLRFSKQNMRIHTGVNPLCQAGVFRQSKVRLIHFPLRIKKNLSANLWKYGDKYEPFSV